MERLGKTPLKMSCKEGNEKIVQLLIDNNNDIYQANDNKETLLTISCLAENQKILQLPIENKSDMNQY